MAEHRLSVCRLLWRLQEEIDGLYARIAVHDALPRAVIATWTADPSHGSTSGAATSSSSSASRTTSARSSDASGHKPRPKYHTLKPEGLGAGAADVVGRCLLGSAADEVYILQPIREHDPADVYLDMNRALGNIAVRSRHVGTELIRVAKPAEKA